MREFAVDAAARIPEVREFAVDAAARIPEVARIPQMPVDNTPRPRPPRVTDPARTHIQPPRRRLGVMRLRIAFEPRRKIGRAALL